MPNDNDPSLRGRENPQEDLHLEHLTQRLEQISRDLSEFNRFWSADKIDRAITAALKKQQQAFEHQIHRLIRDALASFFGGKGSVVQSLFNLIPGFARGGVLNRRVLLSRAGEAGPEVVLPLKKSADGRLGVVAHTPKGGAFSKNRPDKIEVVLSPPPVAASLTSEDQDAIASAVMQAIDQAIDQRFAEQTHQGGVLGQTRFSTGSDRQGF